MTSTPHEIAASTTPEATRLAARLVACWLDPHWLSTVVPATLIGSPAASHAVREMLNDCSPAWVTQPPTTCPTSAGSIPARSTSARWTWASKSAGWIVDRPPPRRPIGLRTASTMTTSDMVVTLRATPVFPPARRSGRRARLGGRAPSGLGQGFARLGQTLFTRFAGLLVQPPIVVGGIDEPELSCHASYLAHQV